MAEKKKKKPATKREKVDKPKVEVKVEPVVKPTPPPKPKREPICATCPSWKQHAPKVGTCFNGDSKYYNKNRAFDVVCDKHG